MEPPDKQAPRRFVAVDHLKALAILAVVAQHTHRHRWLLPAPEIEHFLRGYLLCFHVPTFLLVSGFLYARSGKLPRNEVWRRLTRVLVPYVVASVVAQLLGVAPAPGVGALAFQIVTGTAMGIYYFVPLLVACILLAPLLARCTARVLFGLFAVSLGYALLVGWMPVLQPSHLYNAVAAGHPDYGWTPLTFAQMTVIEIRNPLHFLPCFLAGWMLRLVHDRRPGLLSEHRAILVAASGTVLLLCGIYLLSPRPEAFNAYRFAYTFALVGLAFGCCSDRTPARGVAFLAGTTFTIYLFHHFFQMPVAEIVDEWGPATRVPLLFCVGLAGGTAVAWAGPRVLGPRAARFLLGS